MHSALLPSWAWHERLQLMPMQWLMIRRRKHGKGLCSRVHILISHSRDGRFLAMVVRRCGIDVSLGSSSRGGAAAMRHLVGLIAGGDHIGISLDNRISDATSYRIHAMQKLVAILRRDIDVVRNANRAPWSNGQIEGQINRPKLCKRAMHGRVSTFSPHSFAAS